MTDSSRDLWIIDVIGIGIIACLPLLMFSESKYFLETDSQFAEDVLAYRLQDRLGFFDADSRFAEDVLTNRSQEQSAMTRNQLVDKYGEELTKRYIDEDPSFLWAVIPCEKATQTAFMINYLEEPHIDNELKKSVRGVSRMVGLLVVYWLLTMILRYYHQQFTEYLCRTCNSQANCEDYFVATKAKRSQAFFVSATITFLLAIITAASSLTPPMRGIGISVFDYSVGCFALGYISGFWMLEVKLILDTYFLLQGWKPHRTLWDDAIAFAIVGLILVVVFQNSYLSVATAGAAGLAGGIYIKFSSRKTITANPSEHALA